MTHFPSRLRKSHLGLLLAAGLLSAPLRLAAPPAAAQTASSTSGKPTLIANSKKYKNTGEKPATGRAGSATLSARALLNKKDGDNRTTDLEVTTLAEFDTGATAPGNIDKVQFKPLDQNGNAIYAKNFTGLTGSGPFKAQANGLAHKQQLQVQGNISGIDPKRTGVVTVVANVVLRPDLSPTSLGAPAKTVVNTPVNISAVVTELNQDVGAKADAVLLVGGAEVDRARRIFVDAGGVVTAAFTHTFDSTGTKSVEVRVEGVTPGDYDAANNSKSATIEVVSSSNMSFGAYAEDLGFNHSGTWDNKGKDGSRNLVYDDVGEWAQSGWYQNARVDAWMPKAVTFPLSMKAVHKTGGAEVVSVALDRSAPDYIGSWDNSDSKGSESWISHWQDYSWAHIYTHSYTEKATGQVYEWTYAGSGRHAGDVTYFSRGSYCVWWYTTGDGVCDSPTDYYTWNYEAKNQYGTRMAFGDTYSISQELSSGGQVFTASPEIILQPYNHTYDTGKVCYNWSDWWYYGLTGTNCYQNKGSWIGKVGYAEHHTSR